MFERYTEKARRVIFFARYEAGQYGSRHIESEHLLLGLLREDRLLANQFLQRVSIGEIRNEIEKHIKRGERISTSVEMPLTEECKKILRMAGEEADRFDTRQVGTEHLLLAIFRVEGSLASRVLRERGIKAEEVRGHLGEAAGFARVRITPKLADGAVVTLNAFLAGLKWYDWEKLAPFFAENAQFVDASGKHWKGRQEIEKQFDLLFAPYAKKNVTFFLEGTETGPGESVLASILWENVTMATNPTRAMHRMTILLAPQGDDWAIFLIQVTPVVVQ